MGYRYTEQGTGREVEVTEALSGSVTIMLRNEVVAHRYARQFSGNQLHGMKRWAEHHIAEKLDPILSREDFYQVSWHITFGMMPEHRYVEEFTERDELIAANAINF